MTKDIFISIVGSQSDVNQEEIAINTSGTYHLRNGKHYIQFDEIADDGKSVIQNTLKITDEQVDFTKKGALNSQMVFQLMEETTANYQTPYGNLLFQIHSHLLTLEQSINEIGVMLKYSLSLDGGHISENEIQIIIKAKE